MPLVIGVDGQLLSCRVQKHNSKHLIHSSLTIQRGTWSSGGDGEAQMDRGHDLKASEDTQNICGTSDGILRIFADDIDTRLGLLRDAFLSILVFPDCYLPPEPFRLR